MSRADIESGVKAALEAAASVGKSGGLPDTPKERALFERYMRAHAWALGSYDAIQGCYDTVLVRMLYGVWRDRGGLQEAELSTLRARVAELETETSRIRNCWCKGVSGLLGDYSGEPVPAIDDPQAVVLLERMVQRMANRIAELTDTNAVLSTEDKAASDKGECTMNRKLVKVVWEDNSDHDHGWEDPESVVPQSSKVHSVGFIVFEDSSYLVVAPHWDVSNDTCSGMVTLIKSNILECKEIKLG